MNKLTIDEFKTKLKDLNNKYREGAPEISDVEFDNLLDQFKNLYPDDYTNLRQELFEESGAFKHPFIIGSLDKFKHTESDPLINWRDSTKQEAYVITPKLDGLSIVLYYKQGELQYAVTRGDSEYGEIRTDKLKHIVCTKLPVNKDIVIRGECILTKDGFDKLKLLEEKEFKNPRNAAVGLINSKSENVELFKCLSFYAYSILSINNHKFSTYKSMMDYLSNELNFNTPDYIVLSQRHLVNDVLNAWYQEFKETSDFEIDGLVIQANTVFNENKKIPDYARAYKVNEMLAETEIEDIEWNISKSGYFCPTGIIKPVTLGGAEIKRVTLFHYDYVIGHKIGKGSKVKIQKSGDIIPYITEVLTTSEEPLVPLECPYCKTSLEHVGVELRCPNVNCDIQISKRLAYFLRNTGVEVAGETQLINWGITNIDKLLEFKPDPNYKNQVKFYKELEDKFFTSSSKKLISCMDYDGVSIKTFKKLFHNIFTGDVKDFIDMFGGFMSPNIWRVKAKHIEEKVNGIGLTTLTQIMSKFKDENQQIYNKIVLDPRFTGDNIQTTDKKEYPQSLANLNFCVSGRFEKYSRKEYEDLITNMGGNVLLNMSKKINYLLCNSPTDSSIKITKAKEFNVPIINEEQFEQLWQNQKS
jgi:DNA ligase (NAD+)